MRLTEKKSVDSYIKEVRKKFITGNVLKEVLLSSEYSTVEEVKRVCPEFLKAAVAYIKYAEHQVKVGYMPPQSGWVLPSSEERRALQKTFSLDSIEKVNLVYPSCWLSGYELFIYNLLEALFDAALLVEQGAERKFRELVLLYRSMKKVVEVDGWYFATYGGTVLFINTNQGHIYSIKCSKVARVVRSVGIKEIKRVAEKSSYVLVLNDGSELTLMEGQVLSPFWHREKLLKDHTKEYQNIILKEGSPKVQFPVHIVILLAKFGVNTVKHLILKDSLLTCDHVNMMPSVNAVENLEIVCRRDNTLRAKSKNPSVKKAVYSYNFCTFWESVEASFGMNRKEMLIRIESVRDYWVSELERATVEEILVA